MSYNEVVFSIRSKDFEILQEKFNLLPKKAEYELNNYFWNKGGETLKKRVMQNLPRSSRNKSSYKKAPKTHAKDVESLDKIQYNLGIKIQTKLKPNSKDFGYLIFPDEGRGIHQKRKQEFFGRALETETEKMKKDLLDHFSKKIKEELENGN